MAYSEAWYTPAHLLSKTVTQSEIRKEYTRLRDIAQKRIKRLGQSEFKDTEAYQKYKQGFPKLKDIKNETQLAYMLSALHKYVASNQTVSALRKQRKESLKTLHRHKYNYVNEKNYQKFANFMEDYRQAQLDRKAWGSPDTADLYYQVERLGLDPEKVAKDFSFWMDNKDVLDTMEPSKGKSAGSITAMKRRINNQIKRNSKRKGRRQQRRRK